MSVYDEFPTTHFVQVLDPRPNVPRERRLKAIPAAAIGRYYVNGVGFDMSANWDELKTLAELTPTYTPPAEAPATPRLRDLNGNEWVNILTARPYQVIGTKPWTHPYYAYFDEADRWLAQNAEWLRSTYDVRYLKDLPYMVATEISHIEREKARASGANVGQ